MSRTLAAIAIAAFLTLAGSQAQADAIEGEWAVALEPTMAQVENLMKQQMADVPIDKRAEMEASMAEATKSFRDGMSGISATFTSDGKVTMSDGNDAESGEETGSWTAQGDGYVVQMTEPDDHWTAKLDGDTLTFATEPAAEDGDEASPFMLILQRK